MRLLLDTHSFLWFANGDPALNQPARTEIESLSNERFLSIASAWEIAIKVSIGKLKLSQPFETFIRDATHQNDIAVLGIELVHTIKVINLPFHHRDPFDRMLAAQCLADQLVIVSKDDSFDKYGCNRIW
jgi:PIN domain nuclease of toxin-antitoxin system